MICNALMMDIPPSIVMKWTRHSDYKSMQSYIDITDSAKRNAMSFLNKQQKMDESTKVSRITFGNIDNQDKYTINCGKDRIRTYETL